MVCSWKIGCERQEPNNRIPEDSTVQIQSKIKDSLIGDILLSSFIIHPPPSFHSLQVAHSKSYFLNFPYSY